MKARIDRKECTTYGLCRDSRVNAAELSGCG